MALPVAGEVVRMEGEGEREKRTETGMSRHGKKNRADGRGERVWELEEQQEQQQGAARSSKDGREHDPAWC